MSPDPVPCSFCGRTVAYRLKVQTRGGKPRVRHKCPHGRWCTSGRRLIVGGGVNPGGSLHTLDCRECAVGSRARLDIQGQRP